MLYMYYIHVHRNQIFLPHADDMVRWYDSYHLTHSNRRTLCWDPSTHSHWVNCRQPGETPDLAGKQNAVTKRGQWNDPEGRLFGTCYIGRVHWFQFQISLSILIHEFKHFPKGNHIVKRFRVARLSLGFDPKKYVLILSRYRTWFSSSKPRGCSACQARVPNSNFAKGGGENCW